jgi:hypothetical protein
MRSKLDKTYLGDGAYASFDGHGIELSTERGPGNVHHVYLEPEVFEALLRYAASVWGPDAVACSVRRGAR